MTMILIKLGFFRSSFFCFCISFSFSVYALLAESYNPSPHHSLDQKDFHQKATQPMSSHLENQLLRMMSGLVEAHQYLKDRQQQKFRLKIKDMLSHVRQIDLSQERNLTYHQRLYLHRQLQDLVENMKFITMKGVSQQKQMDSLKRTYSGFIQISKAYALKGSEKKYGVYFCSKNSSVWVQDSSRQVYNPFGQSDRKCGQKFTDCFVKI